MSEPKVPARTATARQALEDALRTELLTAHELSAAVGIAERDVVSHLEHLARSAKARGARFIIERAACGDCGFVFDERQRLSRPSRCPKCRGTHVLGPRFSMR